MKITIELAKEWWETFLIDADKEEVRLEISYDEDGLPVDWNDLIRLYEEEIQEWYSEFKFNN